MPHVAPVVAVWWGYANGNATIVGAVVALVVITAFAYVGRRVWRRGRG